MLSLHLRVQAEWHDPRREEWRGRRSAYRSWYEPTYQSGNLGFRVALVLPGR